MAELKPAQALDLWRTVLVDTVRSAGPDLSARQLAIVLASRAMIMRGGSSRAAFC